MRGHAVILLSLAASPAAGDFSLTLPLDCALGDSCFIQNLVDHDPSSGTSDATCGMLTYDGHKGTDFALLSLADQTTGVTVLAAADGTVTGIRDDMLDVLQVAPDAPDVAGRECGNGLVIQHEAGFETQYCHMARGSILVSSGDSVTAGTALGLVGLSGNTQFPHLHIAVRKDGNIIDPFDADGQQACPDTSTPSLWDTDMLAPTGGIVTVGLSNAVPEFDSVLAGTANTGARADAPAMVAWAYLFGPRDGDVLQIVMTGPQGLVFENTQTMTRNQARAYRAVGKKTPAGGWNIGAYSLVVNHLRDGLLLDSVTETFTVN